MDKKQKNNMWICGMFGWLAVTIGLRLSTKSTAIVEGIALLMILMIMIKDRKRLAKFDLVGRLCFLAGGTLAFSVMTGVLQGVPFPVWSLSCFALFGIGLVAMCWGAHLKDPEKVSKKAVYLTAAFWVFILCVWGIVYSTLELPKKSTKIPENNTGDFPKKSGAY